MSSFLKITNPGTCYPEAFTVLGVSTARGQASKIGQFGSGAKMGVNTCLRHGINPVVVSGDMVVKFDCVTKSMGEKKFDQVIAIINGEKKELGFALDFGALDWDKVDYAVREFVSNAYDQGGCSLSVVDKIDQSVGNNTSIYVEYTPDVQRYHENIDKYFLPASKKATVMDNTSDEIRVYRKGVLVHCSKGPSLFSYNHDQITVDESRNADLYMVRYFCAMSLDSMSQDQALMLVNAFVDNKDYYETDILDTDYMATPMFLRKIRDAFYKMYPGFAITTGDLIKYCKNNKDQLIAVSDKVYKLFMKANIETGDVVGGKKGAENGFMPIDTTADCKRIFLRVWNKVVKLGLHNGKTMPKLAMFSKPMNCGSTIGGYYENDCVYIGRDYVNAKVILEEIGHYVTGADDCTRDFQDWAFNVAGALL